MTRKSQSLPPSAPLRLHFEQLEDRRQMALAAVAVNLFQDDSGSPGAPLVSDTVQVGESFFAEITAQEFYPGREGLASVRLDIAWNPDVLDASDGPFEVQKIVTADLPFLQTGTLDPAAGSIQDLGGSAFIGQGRPIGSAGPERFALLHFRAQEPYAGRLLSLSQGASGFALRPAGSLRDSQIDFEQQAITIVPAPLAAAAPQPAPNPADTTMATIALASVGAPEGENHDLATYLSRRTVALGPVCETVSGGAGPARAPSPLAPSAAPAPTDDLPALSTAPASGESSAEPTAFDWTFVGPRPSGACLPQFARLEDVIAAISADVAAQHQRETP